MVSRLLSAWLFVASGTPPEATAAPTVEPAPAPPTPAEVEYVDDEDHTLTLKQIIPGGLGTALVGTGFVFFIISKFNAGTFRSGTVGSYDELGRLVEQGKRYQALGGGLMLAGAAGLATAAALFFIDHPRRPKVSLSPLPGGGAVWVGGTLP